MEEGDSPFKQYQREQEYPVHGDVGSVEDDARTALD